MHASAWVTRVWQYTGTSLQAEGVVCAKVGVARKHLLCWFYNTETFSVVDILRKERGRLGSLDAAGLVEHGKGQK